MSGLYLSDEAMIDGYYALAVLLLAATLGALVVDLVRWLRRRSDR